MVSRLGMFLALTLAVHSASGNDCATLDALPAPGTIKRDCSSYVSPDSNIVYRSLCHPAYPLAAVRERLEGSVTLKIRVSETGRVVTASVAIPSTHAVLNEAALHYVQSGQFPLFFPPNQSTPACYDVLFPFQFNVSEL
jgi:TonB family protein